MSKGRVASIVFSCAVIAAAGAAMSFARPVASPAERPARQLFELALTARQLGQLDLSKTLLRDAWAADPEDFSPLLELGGNMDEMGFSEAMRRSIIGIAKTRGDSLFSTCVAALLEDSVHAATIQTLQRSAHPVTRRCGALLTSIRLSWDDSAASLWRQFPRSPVVAGSHANTLANRDPRAAWEFARRLAASDAHPMAKITAYWAGSFALHKLRRHTAAEEWERQGERRARAWGPGALMYLMAAYYNHIDVLRQAEMPDSVSVHAHALTDRARAEQLALIDRVDARAIASILWGQGTLFQANGRQTEAIALFEKLATFADSIAHPRLEAFARARFGRSLVKLGRLMEAERELRRARGLGEREGAVIVQRETSHDLLHLFEARGAYDSAVAAGRDFVRYSELAGTRDTRMMAHHDLAWMHRRHGNLAESEREFHSMLAAIDTVDRLHFFAGEYYELAGQLEHASEYYNRALTQGADRSRAMAGLVRTNEALGDIAEAQRYGRMADRDIGAWYPEYSPVVPGLLARHGNTAESRKLYRSSRASALAAGKMHAFAQLALESAELELRLAGSLAARMLADSAVEAAALLGAGEIEVRARAISAVAALRTGGARGRALAALDSAIRRGDAMRIPQLSAALHLLKGEALRSSDPDAAMRAFERAADWVDSTAARIMADPSRAGYRTTHLGVSNQALAMLVGDTLLSRRTARSARWLGRRKSADGRGNSRATIVEDVARRLAADQAVIDYAVLDSVVAALVITRDGATIERLPVTADSLRHWIARFRAPIAPRVGSTIDVAHLGFDEAAAGRLYRALLEPLLPRLGGRARLVIVPDGVLHTVPFEALVTKPGSSARRRYVLDDFTIHYTTNSGALRPRRSSGPLNAFAVGGTHRSAAGGSQEIATIARALGERRITLDSSRVSKRRMRERVRAARVIHFATHAEANDVNPDLARLEIAPGAAEDAWLNAFEIRDWRLPDALVVLSACETGAGRMTGGEGTLSLSRAFLQAGASGTIATLWPVGTPTAMLMGAFYRELARGVGPADALRTARLELRAAGYEHPFYWAPFILTSREL